MKTDIKGKLKYLGVAVVLAFIACTYLTSATTVITDIHLIIGNITIGPDEILVGNTTIGESIDTTDVNVSGDLRVAGNITDGNMKQLIHDFVVASGENVTAGDVVSFVNGYAIRKGFPEGFYSSECVFDAARTEDISAAALSYTRFVVAYRDEGNSEYGTAIIGEINYDDFLYPRIEFGLEYVFNAARTEDISAAALSYTRFVVAYRDEGNSEYGTAIIGEVSGTEIIHDAEITYGTEYMFNAPRTEDISVAALSSSRFVVAYHYYANWLNTYCNTAIIGEVSGTEITYGSEYVFNSTTIDDRVYISAAALSPTKFVVTYCDLSNSDYGTAIIGEVSGTEITYGLKYVFNAALTRYISVAALSSTKFVVAYYDNFYSYGTAITGEISGTEIAYGSEYVFNAASTRYISVAALSSSRFVVVYRDVGNYNYGTAITGYVSGTEIAYSSEYVFNAANTYDDISAAALSSTRFVVAYRDVGNYNYGTAIAGKVPLQANIVGIAKESGTTGETVPVIIVGVSDVHSGLTTGKVYYTDGSGNLTTASTYYRVGLAISENEILLDFNMEIANI